jgi:molecular chaperone DnaJ
MPGYLYVVVIVKQHPLFQRDISGNLHITVPVSYTQLVLGDILSVPTLSGEKVSVRIPPGTRSDTEISIKNHGLPRKSGRGNLMVSLKLVVPKSPAYMDILKELAAIEKEHLTEEQKEFNGNSN